MMKYEQGADLDKLRQIEAQVTEIRLHLQRAEERYIELRLRRAEARLAQLGRELHFLHDRGGPEWTKEESWKIGKEIRLINADISAMKEKM